MKGSKATERVGAKQASSPNKFAVTACVFSLYQTPRLSQCKKDASPTLRTIDGDAGRDVGGEYNAKQLSVCMSVMSRTRRWNPLNTLHARSVSILVIAAPYVIYASILWEPPRTQPQTTRFLSLLQTTEGIYLSLYYVNSYTSVRQKKKTKKSCEMTTVT